jgi:hypothetical protein
LEYAHTVAQHITNQYLVGIKWSAKIPTVKELGLTMCCRRIKMFCPTTKCPNYSPSTTKYPRACYYEPQCWRGYLDLIFVTMKLRIKN